MADLNLAYRWRTSSVVVKIIVINTIIFLGTGLTSLLTPLTTEQLESWFVLPPKIGAFFSQFWSIFTYSFLHLDFWHILINMYMLFWFGRFVLNIFNPKRFLTVYLLGGIAGGLLFLLVYNLTTIFPNPKPVIGASGAVMAIMAFMATYAPHTEVRIIKWNIKLWWLVGFFVLLDVYRLLSYENVGGMLAHLGGALFGFVYAQQLRKGNDIGVWFEKMMDGFANMFKTRKQKPFKKVHRTNTTQTTSRRSKVKDGKSDHQKKVDGILDKIGKSGYESLTKAEKDFLFKSGSKD